VQAISIFGSRWSRFGWPAAALLTAIASGIVIHDAVDLSGLTGAGDVAVAAAFVTAGAIARTSVAGGAPTGTLMVATGATWLLGDLADPLAFLHRGPLVQLLVTAPEGRPRTRMEWLMVVGGYADATVPGLAHNDAATIALCLGLGTVAFGRWAGARGLQRRARALPLAAAITLAYILVVGVLSGPAEAQAVLLAYEGALVATAAACVADLRWGGWTQALVTRLVIDLGDTRTPSSLTSALRSVLGDPSLVVAYRIAEDNYVDEWGRPVEPSAGDTRRTSTPVETGPDVVAVVVHDSAVLQAPEVIDDVAVAVRLALDNVRLPAEIRARLRDLEASRARLMEAHDRARRALEARLAAGVGRHLERAAAALSDAGDSRGEVIRTLNGELERTRQELRRFAAGLHPRDLELGGLPVALRELAAISPVPVEVSVDCGRFDPVVEATAWFVCSEALANVAKHARAGLATVRIERRETHLIVTVEDDGRGGADRDIGRGLAGLGARVESLAGQLHVGERPNGGTRLVALLPLSRQP
jgi:signal transduction histidine kinase